LSSSSIIAPGRVVLLALVGGAASEG
jgi:hypothetical protein